jgi:hypothetical protein
MAVGGGRFTGRSRCASPTYGTQGSSFTIPRLQQVLPHMRDQLVGLKDGATFEKVNGRTSIFAPAEAFSSSGRKPHSASRACSSSLVSDPRRLPIGDELVEHMIGGCRARELSVAPHRI